MTVNYVLRGKDLDGVRKEELLRRRFRTGTFRHRKSRHEVFVVSFHGRTGFDAETLKAAFSGPHPALCS
jgi:hypothetical protein